MDRFQSIRAKLDEGEIGEEDFARLVNEDTQITTFSKQEIKGHLSHLSEQGKVMMSDGIVYMIDWNQLGRPPIDSSTQLYYLRSKK